MGKGSVIFVFDMGESMKIIYLAKRMIRLSGFKYSEEIDRKLASPNISIEEHKNLSMQKKALDLLKQGGVQIGNNWANYTDIDLSINYGVAGNGTYTWCQETSAYHVSVRMSRGNTRLAGLAWTGRAGTSTTMGWRPSLTLKQ